MVTLPAGPLKRIRVDRSKIGANKNQREMQGVYVINVDGVDHEFKQWVCDGPMRGVYNRDVQFNGSAAWLETTAEVRHAEIV